MIIDQPNGFYVLKSLFQMNQHFFTDNFKIFEFEKKKIEEKLNSISSEHHLKWNRTLTFNDAIPVDVEQVYSRLLLHI